jgi:hypothetical protein
MNKSVAQGRSAQTAAFGRLPATGAEKWMMFQAGFGCRLADAE